MTAAKNNRTHPVLDGTFIVDWLVRDWDDEKWEKELSAYKEVGFHYLVLTSNVLFKKEGDIIVDYPTEIDSIRQAFDGKNVIEKLLSNAKKFGMKVFLGINFDDGWWSYWWDAEYTTANREWLYEQMRLGNKIADELYERYRKRYPETFYGWYWIWEFWNSTAMTLTAPGRRQNIKIFADCLNMSLEHFSALDSAMPTMLSPFANLRLNTTMQDINSMWKDILSLVHFRESDILCPQDSIGAGGVQFHQLDEFYAAFKSAADTKPGLRMWANNECFDQNDWSSGTLDRFVAQLEITAPYAEHNITYSYNQYYSPLNVNPGFHETYKKYVTDGFLPIEIPDAPKNLKAEKTGEKTVILKWDHDSVSKIAGYMIYRNGELIGSVKSGRGDAKGPVPELGSSFTDEKPISGKADYAIAAFDFAGNYSIRTTVSFKQ